MRGGAMRRSLRHLTFANVVSVTALVVALGGTAVASVLITSNSQVAKNTISGHHPPSGDHANIIGDSLATQDLALSAGRTYSRRAALAQSTPGALQTILTLPGFGVIEGSCFNAPPVLAYVYFKNTSSQALDVVDVRETFGGSATDDAVVPPNGSVEVVAASSTYGRPGGIEFVIGRNTGSASHLADVTATGLAGSTCVFQAQGTEQVG
jgi:hypothetical protein